MNGGPRVSRDQSEGVLAAGRAVSMAREFAVNCKSVLGNRRARLRRY
jgi:hypothetical protein